MKNNCWATSKRLTTARKHCGPGLFCRRQRPGKRRPKEAALAAAPACRSSIPASGNWLLRRCWQSVASCSRPGKRTKPRGSIARSSANTPISPKPPMPGGGCRPARSCRRSGRYQRNGRGADGVRQGRRRRLPSRTACPPTVWTRRALLSAAVGSGRFARHPAIGPGAGAVARLAAQAVESAPQARGPLWKGAAEAIDQFRAQHPGDPRLLHWICKKP